MEGLGVIGEEREAIGLGIGWRWYEVVWGRV